VTSMRRRMLVWLLSSVLLGGLGATVVVFFQARAQSNEIFDYQLRQLALTLRDRTYSVTQFAEALSGDEALDFVIQVWGADGRQIYHSHPNIALPPPKRLAFDDIEANRAHWRVYVLQQRGLTIEVAQPAAVRDELAFNAAWRTLLPFLFALPLMGLLIWRLVGDEMRVLETTAQAIARRSPESLEPIEAASVPEEVRPLVDALNGLLGRLGGALSHQRQFIADAAHELRTPLTALRLQLQLAERATDSVERARAHETLRAGIERSTHLVAQLLTLAREDPDAPVDMTAPVDVSALARSTLQDFEAPAQAKGLDLIGRIDDGVAARGSATALRALLGNLVDNAIRYTPAGSVTVRAYARDDGAVLEVEDTGPGIPAAERERAFDRFFRGETAPSGGAGLGLAIVRRIAQRHGARVELLDAPGGGLLARVVLAAGSDAASKPLDHR